MQPMTKRLWCESASIRDLRVTGLGGAGRSRWRPRGARSQVGVGERPPADQAKAPGFGRSPSLFRARLQCKTCYDGGEDGTCPGGGFGSPLGHEPCGEGADGGRGRQRVAARAARPSHRRPSWRSRLGAGSASSGPPRTSRWPSQTYTFAFDAAGGIALCADIKIAGSKHWLWRAVDQTGMVLDVLVQSRRDKGAAKRLLRKLLKRQCRTPRVMITDKLVSYGVAQKEIMPGVETGSTRVSTTGRRTRTSRRTGENDK
jgi:hypothetical protein